MMKRIKTVAILMAASLLTGCGTVRTLTGSSKETGFHHAVYGGVRLDAALIRHAHMGKAGAVILIPIADVPFSAVADTVVLPYTGIRAILKRESKEDSNTSLHGSTESRASAPSSAP